MPLNYLTVKRQCAIRLAQMIGTSQATLEAAYSGLWSAALDGAEVPESSFKDTILMIEKELAHVVGSDASNPYRTFLYGRTADLADLAVVPSVDNNNAEFIGVFDSCADAITGAPLTFQPTQTLADTADAFFDDVSLYYYNTTGQQIRHSRPLAYLQGCVWSYETQSDAYDDDGDSPLPQMLANTLAAGVCASAQQVGWVDASNAAGIYAGIYQQGIQMLRIGSSGQPNLPLASQNAVAG